MSLDDQLKEELEGLRLASRLRHTRAYDGRDRIHPVAAGQGQLLSFCSNDYLGLAAHPLLADAAVAAIHSYGVGAGASRLVSGESSPHLNLERALADLVKRPAALLFPTGYQTNLGVLSTLAHHRDLIVSDAANHASIIDACRLSRARILVYPHCDPIAAATALRTPGDFRRRLLVSESIFSMDGDRAPLIALADACHEAGAIFVVDEAHAIGVVGPNGRGLSALLNVTPDVVIGTLGKALGTHGGFAAGSVDLRNILLNRGRQFVYTTAPPAAIAAAGIAAIRHLSTRDGDSHRERALGLAHLARSKFRAAGVEVPGEDLILPIRIGSDNDALSVAAALRDQGILVPAIRPPTVPEGTARLRVTISAAHDARDIDRLVTAVVAAIAANTHARG